MDPEGTARSGRDVCTNGGAASPAQVGQALRLIDDVWSEMRGRTRWGASLEEFSSVPHVSHEAAGQRAERARALAARIARLDLDALPHELRVTLQVAAWHTERWLREADWYWTVFDPTGAWYALFAPTAYCGGYFLNGVFNALQRLTFAETGDLDRYLALVSYLGRLIGELRERTADQAARGIYMPAAQLEQAIPLLDGLKARSLAMLAVPEARLERVGGQAFSRELERRLHADVGAAFDAFSALLSSSYAAHAPDAVGIGQYPDGAAIYAELVRQHTTRDLTPQEVHDIGVERMAHIREGMTKTIAEARFSGDAKDYHLHVNADRRWRADTAQGVTAVFQTYIDRIEPKLSEYFSSVPAAPYGVAALPDALAGAMTFGYYEQPTPEKPSGTYLFNAQNLTQSGLVDLGPLTYHELIPGHHLHIASEFENDGLHPLREHSFFNAFNEGWAEYASTLAGEMGMYETAEERFGRLGSDAFLTARLVVDTGMNALGWSLSRAREYMRENTFHSEREIRSETLRYSCDIPAQSLAYKIGEPVLVRLRDKMRTALGGDFDIRSFHQAVLGPGALPFTLVEAEIDRAIESALSKTTP